ncbi:MAG: hypothetical protein J6A63_01975 [Clostridia bacterium]|nr:hypothetical protein [Clostridia bacterium]
MKKQLLSLCLALAVVAPTASAMNTVFADTQENSFSVTETKTIDLEAAYEEKLGNFEYVDPYYDTWSLSYDFRRKEAYDSTDTWDKLGFGYKFSIDGQQVALYQGISNLYIAILNEDGKTLTDDTSLSVNVKIDVYSGWDIAYGNSTVTKNRIGDIATGDFEPVSGNNAILLGGVVSANRLKHSTNTQTVKPTLKKFTLENGEVEYHYSLSGKHLCSLTFEDDVDGVASYITDSDNHPDACANVDENSTHIESCTYNYISNVVLTPNITYNVDDQLSEEMPSGVLMQEGDKMTVTVTPLGTSKKGRNAYVFQYDDKEFAFVNWSNEAWAIIATNNATTKTGNVYLKDAGSSYATKNTTNMPESGGVVEYTNSNKTVYSGITSTYANNKCSNRYYGRTYHMSIERVTDDTTTTETNESYVTVDGTNYYLYNFYVEAELILQIGLPSNKVKVFPKEIGRTSTYGTLFSEHTYVSANTENNVKAPAASTGDVNNFISYTGAEIRTAIDQEGLRFITTIDKKIVKAYQEIYGESNVEFGVKLTRETDGAFVYAAADKYKEIDGKYVIQVAITDLPEGNYTASYTPQVYIAYRTGETATGCTCVIGDKLDENARSIAFVAQKALEDTNNVFTENQITLLKKFAGITE